MVRIMTKETMVAIVVCDHVLIFSPADGVDTDDTDVGDGGDGQWLQMIKYIYNLSTTLQNQQRLIHSPCLILT